MVKSTVKDIQCGHPLMQHNIISSTENVTLYIYLGGWLGFAYS